MDRFVLLCGILEGPQQQIRKKSASGESWVFLTAGSREKMKEDGKGSLEAEQARSQ